MHKSSKFCLVVFAATLEGFLKVIDETIYFVNGVNC